MNKNIKVEALARVEGEGGLNLTVKNGKITDVRLVIFEPPRFFEAFLRGRSYMETPDITARICGICPIAYQSSSVTAMESILGISVEGQLRELRRLIYCGEWIESHVLHVYMLHLPDFLGFESAIHMAQKHPDAVKTALRLKKAGNELMRIIGGREIHPVNMRVGGFYRAPDKRELTAHLDELKWGRETALGLMKFLATLPFPDFEMDYEFAAMRHESEYPLTGGRIVTSRGIDVAIPDYEKHFEERHVKHTHALHSVIKERGHYMVGPMARYNINYDRLSPVARQAAADGGLGKEVKNPFKSILVRAVETVWAFDEAIRIIEQYEKPDASYIEAAPQAGTGCGSSEAPRGFCWHKYSIDGRGNITAAKIVPPTSQNQGQIEDDLRAYAQSRLHLSDEKLKWECEQAIRNYDPCISCATHFLKLRITRE